MQRASSGSVVPPQGYFDDEEYGETPQFQSPQQNLDEAAQNLKSMLEGIDMSAIKDKETLRRLTNQISGFIETYVASNGDDIPNGGTTDVIAQHLSGLMSMLETGSPAMPQQSFPSPQSSPFKSPLRHMRSPLKPNTPPPKTTRAAELRTSLVNESLEKKRQAEAREERITEGRTITPGAETDLLDRLQKWGENHEHKMKIAVQQKEQQEALRVPAKPTINEKSRALVANIPRIEDRQRDFLQTREHKIEQQRKALLAEEQAKLHGPHINRKSRQLAAHGTDMAKWSEQRERNLERLKKKREEEEACEFKPKISTRSKKLVSSRSQDKSAFERLTNYMPKPAAPVEAAPGKPVITDHARRLKRETPAWQRLYETGRRKPDAGVTVLVEDLEADELEELFDF
ncbi:hypothetical protein J8273_3690 [Carpediemonas membranifera]|uniref:Uncharacterized protein n=1 Tax=Carpediemonas membranifera TaxID=201153 RepID=A0A8J6E4N4_9EUKA|nr:hypothetical protein J8273_3690 [Carpediemonas membranifera]|eukprot:KAG9394717.1 hypothetical protein J8273_3690 [Carpediemonas membranifera]